MSVQTWLKESLPEEPDVVAFQGKDAALCSSVRLWTGLLEENLKKHKCLVFGCFGLFIHSDETAWDMSIPVGYMDWALCEWCKLQAGEEDERACEWCPVYTARGGHDCKTRRPDEDESPYDYFIHTLDAKPMLYWLRRTLELLKQGELESVPVTEKRSERQR